MATSSSELAQSKYYSPAFNSAIFDGPFRIYFAPFQEEQALKVYFHIHKRFETIINNKSLNMGKYDHQILILLYPTADCLLKAFDSNKSEIHHTIIDQCNCLGLIATDAEDLIEDLLMKLESFQNSNLHIPAPIPQSNLLDLD